MLILGIETSCDETAAAVIEDGKYIRSNIIASQIKTHQRYGGVVPEIASRSHVEAIVPVIQQALLEAEVELADLDGIAVTTGPGLVGSLLVGVSAAKGLAAVTDLPLYSVHHIAAHIAANYLISPELKPPFICLVASGGHSQIIKVEEGLQFTVIARTRDDAAGEAFDKVARACGLGYPGGPAIQKAATGGDPTRIRFPRTEFPDGNLDFSFSGVKTAALNFLNRLEQEAKHKNIEKESLVPIADFAAGFQHAVVSVLAEHTIEAAKRLDCRTVVLAGGVAANSALRSLLSEMTAAEGMEFHYPPPILCTDNAAMVGALGSQMCELGIAGATADLDARANWPLDEF